MSDGARTRDILDHNQVLYLLSYAHHERSVGLAEEGSQTWCAIRDSNPEPAD